jgi:hypothetical protein
VDLDRVVVSRTVVERARLELKVFPNYCGVRDGEGGEGEREKERWIGYAREVDRLRVTNNHEERAPQKPHVLKVETANKMG